MHRRVSVSGFLVALALGCSSGGGGGASDAGTDSALAAGGQSTGSGGTASSDAAPSGSGGSSSQPVSELTACRAYLTAGCQRIAECTGADVSACLRSLDLCPDYFFSEGANRTVEDLMGCVDAWPTYPCGVIGTGAVVAACPVPGDRAAGEPCRFHSQCASQRCGGSGGECGTCYEAVEIGDPCDNTVTCPPGIGCIDGVCTEPPIAEPLADAGGASSLPACGGDAGPCPREEGEPCSGAGECVPGAECTGGVCVATGHQGLFEALCGAP